MIKLRTKTNKRFKVADDVSFIEICDQDGGLGAVLHILPNNEINLSIPGESTYENYVNSYKVKRTTLIIHTPKQFSKND